MTSTTDKELIKIKNTVGIYNMIANLFWSVINLTPIFMFCYQYMNLKLIFIFLGAGLSSAILPKSFYNYIQLSDSPVIYKKIGVGFINKFTQNGTIINGLLRKKYPGYKVVSGKSGSTESLLNQTYLFERFHLWVFLFFFLTTVYACLERYFSWALIITINNLVYNVYPAFLQQYIRVRLRFVAGFRDI